MLAALFLSLVPLSDPEQPDLVVLMTGAEVECRVLFEDDEEVVYRAGKKEQRVPRSDTACQRRPKEGLVRHVG